VIDFKTEEYETKQVFYSSKDGTKVPMFITHKKGIKLDGNNPCFLFGYGGFNSYYAPEFRIDRAIFLEQGGVYAVPGIRGGGEYGEEWHKAGTKCSKQNVFDDFIAAAEYLIKEKYTSSEKLAINGRSNGGLLIGAVMTQRPDICKVAIPTVGVLDMLRYHKFTIGWAWASDYGTSENKEEFDCLLKYSPLHNVKPAQYPATLVTTGDHDDRVVPAHSFKFIATLQEQQQGENPTLVRIDVNAGHGAGKPTAKQIEEAADIWSFVFYNLGVDYK
jgi:prolyl oligopeptidase